MKKTELEKIGNNVVRQAPVNIAARRTSLCFQIGRRVDGCIILEYNCGSLRKVNLV